MSLEELRKSVIEKARLKAEKILENARKQAEELVESAKREYMERLRQRKEEIITQVREEESRKYTARISELNAELLKLKRKLIEDIVKEATERIKNLSKTERKESIKRLLKDSLGSGIIGGSFRVKVIERDLKLVKEAVKELGLQKDLIAAEIIPEDYLGGLIIENEDSSVAIDNTYRTRLERAIRIILGELNKEIFKG
ncbi:MAG TPA: hypothetical protein ENF42_04650 [Candidatus Bathyarchaeota archaeon]|nr:hypothetical protein [Candidatus Bathyarchaeota archaeon]